MDFDLKRYRLKLLWSSGETWSVEVRKFRQGIILGHFLSLANKTCISEYKSKYLWRRGHVRQSHGRCYVNSIANKTTPCMWPCVYSTLPNALPRCLCNLSGYRSILLEWDLPDWCHIPKVKEGSGLLCAALAAGPVRADGSALAPGSLPPPPRQFPRGFCCRGLWLPLLPTVRQTILSAAAVRNPTISSSL